MSAAAGEVVMGGVAGLLGWVACPRVMVRLAAVPRAAGNEAWREPARWGGRAGCGVMPTVGNGGVSSLVCLGTCRLTDNNVRLELKNMQVPSLFVLDVLMETGTFRVDTQLCCFRNIFR